MSKKSFFLVLAPLEQAFCNNYEGEIVYLGNKNFNSLKNLNNSSKKITKKNSHWHNKENLIQDNNYLEDLEKRFFDKFYKSLNNTLKVSYPKKYWEIFLGRVIVQIIYILYERWQTLNNIKNKHELTETKILKKNDNILIFQNGSELSQNIANSDLLNFEINSEIIRNIPEIDYEEIEIKDDTKIFNNKNNKNNKNYFQIKYIRFKYIKILFSLAQKYLLDLFYFFVNKKNYFIYISPKIKSKTNLIIRKKFKQPNIKFNFKKLDFNLSYSFSLRKKLSSNLNFEALNSFEKFLKKKFITMLPLCYLEGYQNLVATNVENKKKQVPKVMFLHFDEIMNENATYLEWVGYNKINGSKIFLIQTGGGLFTPKLEIREEFTKNKIYDVLFHYGKKDFGKKIIGAGFERIFFDEKVKSDPNGNIIFALYPGDGYSTGLLSTTKRFQDDWSEYQEDIINFIERLNPQIREKIIIRLKKRHHVNEANRDYFNTEKNLRKKFPKLRFDNYKKRLNDMLPDTSIVIVTHNSTTLLETLSKNIPTIMLMDFNKHKLSDTADKFYKNLSAVGILHFKAESASEKLLTVWKNPDEWWNSKEVQKVRQEFCDEYAFLPNDYEKFFLEKISNQINHIN